MAADQLTEEQIAARHKLGRWMLIVGIVLLLMGLYISAFMIPDLVQASGGPQSLTLAEAAQVAGPESTYASIQDGDWDCATLTYVRGLSPSHRRYGGLREETKSTEIFFTDASRDVVMFVTLSGEVECDTLAEQTPSGYLYAMNDATRQELTNDARLARYFMADTFLEFCGYCGQENSLIGVIFGSVFTLSGIAMLVFGRNLRVTYRRNP